MRTHPFFTQALIDCRDKSLIGGKAANLGRLARLGFAVPDGFVVTTRAYRHAQQQAGESPAIVVQSAAHTAFSSDYEGQGSTRTALANQHGHAQGPNSLPHEVAEEIRLAYRAMGGVSVAVRSSATAEDMAAASMAGQYETFLDITGEEALLDAVCRCWSSLDSPRIRSYLREHQIDPARVAMAVVVQRLVSADVAGVLFTANPHTGTMSEMLVEASWGLGESVVSGRVQPDVLRLEGQTGRVLAATIADKRVHLAAGAGEERAVEESRRRLPCLRSRDVHRLWQVGRQVAERFGAPQDIEWAIHDGELYVLQSRPITTLGEAEAYEDVLRNTRQFLRDQSRAGRGPWALHNLAETLAHPTPLTWSIISRFMSGAGGFGAMYRQVGFDPSPTVSREGFLDCIGGRIYMDASRASDMFQENFPFAYDLAELQRSPDASQTPPTIPRGTFSERGKAARRLMAVNAKLAEMSLDFDRQLNQEVFPAFARWCAEEKRRDLAALTAEELVELWQRREKHVLDEFSPQSLLPSLISGMALAELRTFLAENFWNDDPDSLSQLISSGGPPNRTVIADGELYEVAVGIRPLQQWIGDHGHRAAGEFDLAAVRWREQPAAAREMAARLAGGENPLERYRRHGDEVNRRIEALSAQLPAADRRELARGVDLVRRYVAFREDGKDFLMLGYDLLRDAALEAGRRLEIGQDIFYLTRQDMFDALRVGFAPHHLIEQRKGIYRAESRLSLPRVIDEKSIDAIGEVPEVKASGEGYKAFAVSSGVASGPARVLHSPTEAGELGRGYILVCPSTDPSWTPLFVNAAGLVLECGGTLSHGAVVAREMGLPAVVLPDATRIFQDGQMIRVDGRGGSVGLADASAASENGNGNGHVASATAPAASSPTPAPATGPDSAPEPSDPQDIHVPHDRIPPPEGRKDRRAAKLRNICAIGWGVYLLAVCLLPAEMLYQPSLTVIDWVLWPIARGLGKPAVVAIVSAALAILTLLIQKFLTDNDRLVEAKRRAAILNKEARALPPESPRRAALLRLGGGVQMRTLLAAMAPIAIVLGPMVMTFFWFMERVDPAKWNADPGSGKSIPIVARIESDFAGPVTIRVPEPLQLDATTASSQTLLPIRPTLDHLLHLLRQPRNDPGGPWELQYVPDVGREQTAAQLEADMHALPPRGLTWQVVAPEHLTGRFPITVETAGHPPTTVYLVLGDDTPPAPSIVEGAARSPVKELNITYPTSAQARVFWRPFAGLEHFSWIPGGSRLAAKEVGWIWVYVLAYLPALFLLRAILRLA